MFILRKKGTKLYVKDYNYFGHAQLTTNINNARLYSNLHSLSTVVAEWDSSTLSYEYAYLDDFDVLEVEIIIKKQYNNLTRTGRTR